MLLDFYTVFIVYCYAPEHQVKFIVCANLCNKTVSVKCRPSGVN